MLNQLRKERRKKGSAMTWKNRLIAGALGIGAVGIAADGVVHFEGKRNTAYLDPPSIPTICYGHIRGVKLRQTHTDAECDELLRADLGDALAVVDHRVTVHMSEARRAALTSFVYNVGAEKFSKSTLLAYLNGGNTQAACDQLMRWVYADGRKLPGLVKRRAEERELCLMEYP